MGARIRAYDWASTPLGPMERWPQSLRTAVDMIIHSAFPAAIVWGPNLITIHNDAFRPILGTKPEALGRPFSEVWREAWHEIGPIAERALAGEPTFIEDFPLIVERKGYPEQAYFTFCYSPIRDEAGNVAGFLDTVVETTSKVLAERRLVAERERLAQMFEQAPGLMALLRGADHVFELANPACMQLIGHRDVIGKPIREALPEIEGQGFLELLDDVYRTGKARVGRAMKVALRRTPDGPAEERFIDVVYQPITDADGKVSGIFVEGSDVTERERADEGLRASEARFRNALEIETVGIIFFDTEGQITDANDAFLKMSGFDRDDLAAGRLRWDKMTPPEWMPASLRAVEELKAHGSTTPYEKEYYRKDGSRYWALFAAKALGDRGGVEFILDISERKRAEEQRERLFQELNHRVRNALALVMGIASQTRRHSDSLDAFAEAFEGRLQSLASAYGLLGRGEWARTDLYQLVELSLAPYRRTEGENVVLDGPDVMLPADAALPLHMIFHELATNAAKYGALSAFAGLVEVRWAVEPADGDSSRLRLCWRESGGPAVAPPTRRGMGTSLIERSADYELGGKAEIAFRPDGLRCTLTIPLPGSGPAGPG